MPINGMVLKQGGANAVTGGTDVTYVADGQEVTGGVHVVNTTGADYRTRGNITFKNRVPTYNQATDEWSKGKQSITFVIPKLLASGKISFNLVRIERETHPESTAAEMLELLTQGAQMCFDTDLANFWAYGSLA